MNNGINGNEVMKQITNNVDQCKRLNSFPVQYFGPSKKEVCYPTNTSLSQKINSLNSIVAPVNNKGCDFDVRVNERSSSGVDIVSKNIEHTPVSSLFFSKTNIEALQVGLQNTIFNKSQGCFNIGKQSEIELKIVMRSIYFDYLKNGFNNLSFYPNNNPLNNFDRDVVNIVRKLNGGVLTWCSQEILTNLRQHNDFKRELQNNGKLNLMDRPENHNITGTKTLGFL